MARSIAAVISFAALLESGCSTSGVQKPFVNWIDSGTFHAQHICSAASMTCRSVAHAVFLVGPELGDKKLDSAVIKAFHTNSRESKPNLTEGAYVMFENHVVNGVCQGSTFANTTRGMNCTNFFPARVYDWGFEKVGPYKPTDLPDVVRVFLVLEGADEPTSIAEIPYEFHIVESNNAPELTISYNSFATVAYQDGDEVIAHVVYSAAPAGSALANLNTSGQFSVDGACWQDGSAIFENHIDDKDGVFYQSFQFDVRWSGVGHEVCFKVVVSENNSTVHEEHCLKVCSTPAPFRYPLGYCPALEFVLV